MEMMGIQFSNPESADEAQVVADLGSYPEVRAILIERLSKPR